MKLGLIVYLHEIFHLTKDLGMAERVWQGVAKKSLKKALKIGFWLHFWYFQDYIKNHNICDTLACTT